MEHPDSMGPFWAAYCTTPNNRIWAVGYIYIALWLTLHRLWCPDDEDDLCRTCPLTSLTHNRKMEGFVFMRSLQMAYVVPSPPSLPLLLLFFSWSTSLSMPLCGLLLPFNPTHLACKMCVWTQVSEHAVDEKKCSLCQSLWIWERCVPWHFLSLAPIKHSSSMELCLLPSISLRSVIAP